MQRLRTNLNKLMMLREIKNRNQVLDAPERNRYGNIYEGTQFFGR